MRIWLKFIDWLGSLKTTNAKLNDEIATLRFEVDVLRLANKELRKKVENLGQEYADYIAATEDRFHAIAALETPKANATVRNMAKLARGSAHQ